MKTNFIFKTIAIVFAILYVHFACGYDLNIHIHTETYDGILVILLA